MIERRNFLRQAMTAAAAVIALPAKPIMDWFAPPQSLGLKHLKVTVLWHDYASSKIDRLTSERLARNVQSELERRLEEGASRFLEEKPMASNNKKEDVSEKVVSLRDAPQENLIETYNAFFEFHPARDESDDYSLAQPHALRFVPSVLSDNTAINKTVGDIVVGPIDLSHKMKNITLEPKQCNDADLSCGPWLDWLRR